MNELYETYLDESTQVCLAFNKKTKSTILSLRDMRGEITYKEMMDLVMNVRKRYTRKQFLKIDPHDFIDIVKESLIVQCVTDWLEAK